MSRQIGGAAIERQGTPPLAERRDSAVTILDAEQPADASFRCGLRAGIRRSEMPERQHSACRVVGVRHATRQIRPRPPTWRRVRVRVFLLALLCAQPLEDANAIRLRQLSVLRQRVD